MGSVFSHLILDVQNLERSLVFYHDLLDLPIVREDEWDGNRLAFLSTGMTEILLLQQPRSDHNPHLDRSGGLVINFHVQNLPGVAKMLQERDVRVLRELQTVLWGESTLLVADPDGYAVLLSEASHHTLH